MGKKLQKLIQKNKKSGKMGCKLGPFKTVGNEEMRRTESDGTAISSNRVMSAS